MTITTTALDRLSRVLTHKKLDPDHEECFLVMRFPEGPKDGHYLVQVPNRSLNPTEDFEIWVEDSKEAEINGSRTVGYLHTHPAGDPYPSENDLSGARSPYFGGMHEVGSDKVIWYRDGLVIHVSFLTTYPVDPGFAEIS